MAECERLPFDLPEAEEELVAGYQTEYSGIKYGLFYLASYLNLLVSSLFVTVLYLGGWNLSIPYISFFGFFQMNKMIKQMRTTVIRTQSAKRKMQNGGICCADDFKSSPKATQ